MKIKQIFGSMLFVCFLVLTGCSDSKLPPLPEEQVLTNVRDSNSDFHGTGLEFSDYEITCQYEDEEMGEQEISISYVAENADVSYFGDMTLRYWYNDREWIMEDATRDMDYYVAKQDCSPELPEETLRQNYDGYDVEITMLSQESPADNENAFLYEVKGQENSVCSWTDQWKIMCSYDLKKGWQVSSDEGEKTAETWDLCGHYVCNNENLSMTVDLNQFEIDLVNDQFTAVLDYSMTSHISNDDIYGGPVMKKDMTYSSETPLTVTGSLGYDNRYQVIQIGDLAELYICGRTVSWDPIGEGLGLWVQIKGNYTETYGEYWLER